MYLYTVSSEFPQERTLAYPIHEVRVGFPLTQEIFAGNQVYCLISFIQQHSGIFLSSNWACKMSVVSNWHCSFPLCLWHFGPYGQDQSSARLYL